VVGPAVILSAVVKANGYGHGAAQVARAALAGGASRLAVAQPDEGVHLRRTGLSAPILVLGPTPLSLVASNVANDLATTVMRMDTAQALASAAIARGVKATVHIEVDTGMGRNGLLPDEVIPFAQAVSTLSGLYLEGLWTHFATAEEQDSSFTHHQLCVLLAVSSRLRESGVDIPLRHAANSAGTICHPDTHLDMVRCGLAIYGLYPGDACRGAIALHPAMSLHSRVARLRTLPAGSPVSYGRSYTTAAPTMVAFMPIGYADGLRRALSNHGSVLIRGQRAPLIGRICMDGCMADVSATAGVQEGDEAVFLGRQGQAEITADEMAGLIGTVSYEVVTGIGQRVPRVYGRNGVRGGG
jgi:alanine racemase